jgi:RNA polymerase sigma-70 factor, ECF subfamily
VVRARDAEEDRDVALAAGRRDAELSLLVTMAAEGDRPALDRLIGLIRVPVVRYCRARLGAVNGHQTAEDVAQDVLVAVCDSVRRYRPGEAAAMSFVYGIARNKVADAYRAAARERAEPTDQVPDTIAEALGPEGSALRNGDLEELRALLEQLPVMLREVLVLRVAMQFSASETARTVGSTPGAVRVAQHRALAKLRTMVAERQAG